MGNLLKAPGFETDNWHKVDQFGTMTVPEGWQAFYLHKPGKHQVPWDPQNESGISTPEFKPVDAKPPTSIHLAFIRDSGQPVGSASGKSLTQDSTNRFRYRLARSFASPRGHTVGATVATRQLPVVTPMIPSGVMART